MGTDDLPKTEEAVPAEAPSSLEQQIIRQIEYYFGNYNLSRDKFLKEQLKVDDGWVPLETMVKFNRLKKLSEDFNVIVQALKKSPNQLMEVSEDCTKIRRRTAAPVPEEDYNKRQEEFDTRTLYVKGFKKTNTLDELLEFFKDYKVEHVYMRKYVNKTDNSKQFKGSVFATFETREDAQTFLETKGIKYNGVDLLKEWKVDYHKRKGDALNKLRAEREKKREQNKAEQEKECQKTIENEMVRGCLLKIENLNESTTRESIQKVFESHGTIVYCDYSRGQPSAVLRFESPEAKSVMENVKKDGETVKIGSSDATLSVIEGDAEIEYWKNIAIWRAERKKNKPFNRGHRNFQNKKRKFGDRRRGRNKGNENEEDGDENDKEGKENDKECNENDKDNDASEPPQKQAKLVTSEVDGEKTSTTMEVGSDATSEQKKAEAEPQSES